MQLKFVALVLILSGCGAADVVVPLPPPPALPPVDELALDVEVVTAVEFARPLEIIVAEIRNHSTEIITEDLCSGGIEGFGYLPGVWNGSYGVSRACPFIWPRGVVPQTSREILPGQSVADTFHVNGQAYAGSWRFWFYLTDRDGDLLPLSRRVSRSFEVIR